jgi:hypothetical protein
MLNRHAQFLPASTVYQHDRSPARPFTSTTVHGKGLTKAPPDIMCSLKARSTTAHEHDNRSRARRTHRRKCAVITRAPRIIRLLCYKL